MKKTILKSAQNFDRPVEKLKRDELGIEELGSVTGGIKWSPGKSSNIDQPAHPPSGMAPAE